MQMEVTMSNIVYVGIDVHKDTNNLCMYRATDHTTFAEKKLDAGVEYITRYLEKARKDFQLGADCQFVLGYEAGPTGYGLCRSLQAKHFDCVIMAPTTIRKASGQKVKTDRKDSRMLAMTLACDAYKAVYLPDPEDEAVKEYTRARNTLAKHLKKAKRNLLSFLLRIGMPYPDEGSYWTIKFNEWLDALDFKDKKLKFSFQTYKQEARDLEGKMSLMDSEIETIADEPRYQEKVDKLVSFQGIQTHTALSLVCEIGDFSRFPTAGEFSSYLGLVPGQDSSGQRIQYDRITKSGNSRLRLLLVEAAKGIKNSDPYKKSKRILVRQKGQSPEVIAYADKGSKRIKALMRHLEVEGKKNCNVATTAGARELACFVWGMMTGNTN